MYLIVNKKNQTILYMANSVPGEEKKPEDIFPDFDAATMTFGRSPQQSIPARFTIENGVVKDLDPPSELPVETIEKARERFLHHFSDRALTLRQGLIPDHEFMNAGIGVYDEDRTQSIRATAEAFRNEYHRLAAAVGKAKSVKALEAIKASFPTAIVPGKNRSTTKPK